MNSVKEVLSRIQQTVGARSLDELAERLQVARSTLNGWGTRRSIPYEKCVEVAEQYGVSLDWLMLGRGSLTAEQEELKQLRARVHELEQRLQVKTMSEPFAALAALAEQLNSMPQPVGDVKTAWKVLNLLSSEGPLTDAAIQSRLGLSQQALEYYLRLLYPANLISKTSSGWIQTGMALTNATTREEFLMLCRQASSVMSTALASRMAGQRSAVAVAEVKIAGPLPGEQILGAIRNALLSIENPAGSVINVEIGLTPE